MEPRRGRLTETQLALARAFFRQTKGFFLTGGAVLAAAARELGGTVEIITTSPDFRRSITHLGAEHIKVDLLEWLRALEGRMLKVAPPA